MANGANFIQTLQALNALGVQPGVLNSTRGADGVFGFAPEGGAAPILPALLPLPAPRPALVNPPIEAPVSLFQPSPPPIAPEQPLDQAIIQWFLAMAGPEPVAPVISPASRLETIATALQGFGAGVAGQGPQFVAQVRERRERPQREFEQRQREFQAERRQLGLIGTQVALSQAKRRQQQQQRQAERQFERELDDLAGRARIRREDEREQLRDLLLRNRQREEFDRETARRADEQQREFKNRVELEKLKSRLQREETRERRAATPGLTVATFKDRKSVV